MKIHQGLNAIGFLSGQAFGEATVVCPSCGFHYTHVLRGGTLMGSDQSEAKQDYEGMELSGTTPSRRSAAEIVFSCENCPKLFALVIQQHKGNNFVEIHEDIPNYSE
jgi:hypothetical protein